MVMPVPVTLPVPPLLTLAEFVDVAGELQLDELATRNDRWIHGVQWTSRVCEDLGGTNDVGCDPTALDMQPTATRGEAYPVLNTQVGFMLWRAIQCSTLSTTWEQLQAEAEPNFRLWLSHAIAQEAMTGAASGGLSIAGEADILAAPSTITATVGRLDAWLGTKIGNGQGILHMNRLALAEGVAIGVLRFNQGKYFTPAGNKVIADAGYYPLAPESEPEPIADEPWVFATGPVYFKVSGPRLLSQFLHEGLDFTGNIMEAISTAYGIVVFEPCSVAAAQVLLEGPVGS
jgi:hypothetical protein